MKKRFGILLLLFTLSFALLFPLSVQGEEELTISEWNVNANLLENGDLSIIEDIAFDFNDEFNGVFREIILHKTDGLSDLSVFEVVKGNVKNYTKVSKAKNGDSNVYSVKDEGDRVIIQIYSPSEDETKTFRLSYTIKNVAVRYNDIGELYYKFLGDENATPIDRFTVNLTLPQKDLEQTVKVFAHGPLHGKVENIDDRTYTFDVESVESNTYIEARVLFPTEFIPTSRNVRTYDHYESILEEEAAYERRIEEEQERFEKTQGVLGYSSLVASGLLGFIAFIAFLLYKHPKERTYGEQTSIPEDCTPAVAAHLTGTILGSKVLVATILDLFRKGYLKIEGEVGAEGDYTIVKKREGDSLLLSHENTLLNLLFERVGSGASVTLNAIKSYGKSHGREFYRLYTEWQGRVKADTVSKDYYDPKQKQGVFFLVSAVLLFVLGIITLIYENLFGLLSLGVSMVIFVYSLSLIYRLSNHGAQLRLKWKSFKRYMKRTNQKISIEDYLEYEYDPSLIYAMALNLDQNKKDNFDPSPMNTTMYSHHWLLWYLLLHNDTHFEKSMNDSFNPTSPYSNSTTGGGGFTAGGGGGAGGGGAGGF